MQSPAIRIGLGLCLFAVCGAATAAHAQAPESSKAAYEGTTASPAPRQSISQRAIHRRAAHEAEQRLARIDNRRWTGESVARPNIGQTWDFTERGMTANYPWLLYHPYPYYGGYYRPVVAPAAR